MIGMLQIIIIMGCIYLVMKAIAITQAGLAVPAAVIGLAGAALCFWLMLQQSAAVEPPYWGG